MDAEAYADMLPWLVFLVVDRKSGLSVGWAAACATACAAGLAGWSYWRGRRAPLPLLALACFIPCLVGALAFPAWDSAIGLTRSIAVLTVSVSAFVSLRFTPISEAYTTSLVAPGVPQTPRFRQVNVEMTAAWGVGSLLAAVTCAVATIVTGSFAFTFMDWVVPLVIAVGTVLWATRRWELFRLSLDGADANDTVLVQPVSLLPGEPGTREGAGLAVVHELQFERAQRSADRRML